MDRKFVIHQSQIAKPKVPPKPPELNKPSPQKFSYTAGSPIPSDGFCVAPAPPIPPKPDSKSGVTLNDRAKRPSSVSPAVPDGIRIPALDEFSSKTDLSSTLRRRSAPHVKHLSLAQPTVDDYVDLEVNNACNGIDASSRDVKGIMTMFEGRITTSPQPPPIPVRPPPVVKHDNETQPLKPNTLDLEQSFVHDDMKKQDLDSDAVAVLRPDRAQNVRKHHPEHDDSNTDSGVSRTTENGSSSSDESFSNWTSSATSTVVDDTDQDSEQVEQALTVDSSSFFVPLFWF